MCTTCGCGDAEHDHPHTDGHPDDGHRHGHGHAHGHGHGHSHASPTTRITSPQVPAAKRDELRRIDTPRTISIERQLLAKNALLAAENRRRLDAARVSVLNLIGAPGAGKTSLLETTIPRLGKAIAVSVLEGDQATDRDAQRIASTGCRVFQINTGAGCHLDAAMIAAGIEKVKPPPSSVVFVENVGNLVCPALFDLGERLKIVVMSVAEGDDKPLKYPHVFGAADLFVLTKTDLLPHVTFDAARCFEYARSVNRTIKCIALSAKTGTGVDAFCDFVRGEAARMGGAA